MGNYCDLHTHSIYSDGTYTPAEIIDAAIEARLSAVALCDHNTVDGLYEFEEYAKDKNIEAVSGVEFSVAYKDIEVHILGLFVPKESYGQIKDLLSDVIRRKEASNLLLVDSLRQAGYSISMGEVREKFPDATINRSHIAAILTEKGYTASVSEAMNGILSRKAGYYVPPKRLDAMECISFITAIGAVPVIAHPFLNFTEEELREFITEGKKHGLCGMECEYSTYNKENSRLSMSIVNEYGILPSGGSDFHGTRKPEIGIGIGKGDLRVPTEWMTELKKATK